MRRRALPETSILIRWRCRLVSCRRTILCSALALRFIRSRSPGGQARRRNQAQSQAPKRASKYGHRAPTIHGFIAAAALADGADGAEHALHRRCHGRLGGGLSSDSVNPSPAGDFDFDPGCDPLYEPEAESAATVSAHDVNARVSGGDGFGSDALCIVVCSARGWMGDAVSSGLSHCALWLAPLAAGPSAQRDTVCIFAESAYGPCIS